jgi:hypothetical protein
VTTATPDNPLLAAALAYAARGWRVIPLHSWDVRGCSCGSAVCGSPGKHPRTKSGLKDGTTDPDVIRGWWATWPRANVAVVCGPESGVWMVGPDGEQGIADFARLQSERGPVEEPVLAETQGGGRHYLFAWPDDGEPIPNRKNHRGTKIDVRGRGDGPGYFVAAPSVGEKGRYEWASPPVAGRPLRFSPYWLLEWARGTDPKPTAEPVRVPTPAVEPDRADVHRRAVQYLNRMPEAVSKERGHDATFWAARVLVWGFALPEHEALALLATYYNPRCKPPWGERELLHKVREAAARPFNKQKGWLLASANPHHDFPMPQPAAVQPSAGGGPTPPGQKPWEVRPCGGDGPKFVTAEELEATVFPPPKWAIDGLLPEGLTVLAGDPKAGKSWLALLLGWAAAAGGELDGRAVTPGEALYLALEDPYRRLQSRMRALRRGVAYDISRRLSFSTDFPRADAGGLYHIAEWLEARKGAARLVIVDTLACFRKVQTGKGNGYAEDYEALGSLQKLCHHYQVCGLVVHHTRKVKGTDPFADISGTQGVSGAADTLWVLDSDSDMGGGRLYMKGRDVPPTTIPLTFEKKHQRWRLGAAADGILTDGRGGAAGPSGGNLIDNCVAWLLKFLAEFAFPSSEVEAAANEARHAFPTLKEAKQKISRRKGGRLWARQLAGEWWNGLGTPDQWKLRPTPDRQIGRSADRTPPARQDTVEGADPADPDEPF